MRWDLTALLTEQAALDAAIFAKSRESYATTTNRRQLALLVELAELANALRFFKFWSTTQTGDRSAVLEEYADVLHFALTFCIQHDATVTFSLLPNKQHQQLVTDKDKQKALARRFLRLFTLAQNVNNALGANAFLRALLVLGTVLDFSVADVVAAYRKKHAINVGRASSNY